jgi:hypothetical protein
MPRKLESGGSYSYILKSDRDKQPPPTFKLRILSGRDDDKVRDIAVEYGKLTDSQLKADMLREALQIVVVGWHDMGGIEFSHQALEDLLTKRECWELISDATLEASLTADERKKLESLPSSETG